jgi:hypothetical protein
MAGVKRGILKSRGEGQMATTSRKWRHRLRGTVYEEIGRAELQAADRNRPHPMEQDTLVIYRGADGKLWARWDVEFGDGRFEEQVEE